MKSLLLLTLISLPPTALLAGSSSAADQAFEEGLAALENGDSDAALSLMEQAIETEPDNLRFNNEYRQAVIRSEAYEHCLAFYERLVSEHPDSFSAYLNYGFAYVDKIPAAGSITQVILANSALTQFTKALELKPSWLTYYTRGSSYLYWPKVFQRAALGVSDLEAAMKIQKSGPLKSQYVRTYIALGDGYWKTDQIEKARAVWKEGLEEFPGEQRLSERLSREGEELKKYIDDALDYSLRVDTDISELWRGDGTQ